MPALIASMRDIFKLHPSIKILIAATVRNQETIECFLQACSESLHTGVPLYIEAMLDENAFDLEDLQIPVPEYLEQTGFFLVNEPNVRIFEIARSSPAKDAFAV